MVTRYRTFSFPRICHNAAERNSTICRFFFHYNLLYISLYFIHKGFWRGARLLAPGKMYQLLNTMYNIRVFSNICNYVLGLLGSTINYTSRSKMSFRAIYRWKSEWVLLTEFCVLCLKSFEDYTLSCIGTHKKRLHHSGFMDALADGVRGLMKHTSTQRELEHGGYDKDFSKLNLLAL